MKEKKIGPVIILAAFILIICLPNILWIPLEKYINKGTSENRVLAEKPKFTVENYATYAKDYNAYFNDNLPFRNVLVKINTALDYFVYKKSSSDYVITGKDNWLFYSRVDDGDPVGSYRGDVLLTENDLAIIAQNCINQRDFLASQGKEFVIFIAPNKERIYSEYMPERYGKPSEVYQVLQIVEYLKNNTDIRVVYPYEELMEAKAKLKQNIWYVTDTHWNWVGGYVGATAMLKELGIEMPSIDSDGISILEGEHVSGDLAGVLNLEDQLKFADREYAVEGYDTHDMETLAWDFHNVIQYRAIGADPRKIYVLRDSFSSQMSTYIGSQFNESYLRHRDTYSYADFVEQNPDIFVYETVERYVLGLANFSVQ